MSDKKILRADIQVLRAIAVMLVVLFHLWPQKFMSGFIGVDVFFVISGFLISGHLLDEALQTSKIRILNFWARRIRRLFPIALLVITVTSLLVLFYLDISEWTEFSKQAIASVFYSENWVLALNSVDYLNADNLPTAVQQYWSLSVEEQFYIIWPPLIVAIIWFTKTKWKKLPKNILVTLLLLFVASYGFSIFLAATNNPSSYFNTFSRIWEFSFGAICVVLSRKFENNINQKLLSLFRFAGCILLTISVIVISPEISFPGWIAILPVLGTGLILFSGTRKNAEAPKRLSYLFSPIVWIGGISYSIYLWHWPFIVLFPTIFGVEPNTISKCALLLFVILLSWLSTRWIEKPFQQVKFLIKAHDSRTYVAALVAAAIALIPVFDLLGTVIFRSSQANAVVEELSKSDCFGARSREQIVACELAEPTPLLPDLSEVHDDVPTEANECKSDTTEVKTCSFGKIGSKTRVALIGDSHAGHWFPALLQIASRNDWQVDLYLRSSCTFSTVQRSPLFKECPVWSQAAINLIEKSGPYKYAFITSLAPNLYGDGIDPKLVKIGFDNVWEPMIQAGTKIVVIRDTPYWLEDPLACITTNSKDYEKCSKPLNEVFQTPDLEFEVATKNPGIVPLDMSQYFCDKEFCQTVIGGVIVYSDFHHMTATYSKSLWRPLELALENRLSIKLK